MQGDHERVGALHALERLVGLLEERLFGGWINPWTTSLVERVVPWEPLRDLLVGPYGVVTMALTYALALILLGSAVQDSANGKDVYQAFAVRMSLFVGVTA